MKVLLAFALALLISGISDSGGQLGYLWNWDELTSRADAIVIAEHKGTVEARRGVEHPDLRPPLPALEMESVFKVLAVLKAGRDGGAPTLRLRHYRVDLEEFHRREGPLKGLVNAGSSLDFGREKGPSLLFLTHIEGNLYRPLSGYTFPTDSVFLLRSLGG